MAACDLSHHDRISLKRFGWHESDAIFRQTALVSSGRSKSRDEGSNSKSKGDVDACISWSDVDTSSATTG
jgi:hypothetical protein